MNPDSNRPGNAAVDDILEELKNKGGQAPAGAAPNVDAILAEMGLGAKKPSPFDYVRPGAGVPPAAPPVAQKAPPAPMAPAPAHEEAPPKEPAPELLYEESPPEEPEYGPEFEEPYEEETPPPAKETPPEKQKKSPTGTMIWDIEPQHTGMGPRVGKAAALDKVDPDKFVGDRELSRWFGDGAEMPTSRKERKKAEKEMRRRLADEELHTRRRGKALRAQQEEGYREETYPEEEYAGDEPAEETYIEEESYTALAENDRQAAAWQEPETPAAPSEDWEEPKAPARPAARGGALPGGFAPPVEFDFHEKPRRKGFFGRLLGKDEDDDIAADEACAEDDWAEEPAPYEDAFADAFGGAQPVPRRAARGAVLRAGEPMEDETAISPAAKARPAQRPAPTADDTDDFVEADTASFAAAYKRPPAPKADESPVDPLLAGTAGFAAAMRPKADGQPENARKEAFPAAPAKGEATSQPVSTPDEEADPNTAEFAAALGKGPVVRAPKPAAPGAHTAGKANTIPDTNDNAPTTVFSVADLETTPVELPGEADSDTRSFELGGQDDAERVPTAAFTQEFAAEAAPVADDRSLFLDDMVDDRFRQFFSETVVMDRATEEQAEKARKRRKRTRSAILTGEFARMAELVEQADMAEEAGQEVPEDESFDDYDRPQDAPAVEGDIAALRTALSRRTAATGVIAVLLLWMSLSFSQVLPLPEALSFAVSPFVFTGVYLALLLLAAAINFTTVATGLAGLFTAPTVDCAPALAALGALAQGAVLLVQIINKQPAQATLFGALAALALCFNALGKRVRAVSILRNFKLASAGMDHSAAYTLDSTNELAYNITKGLEEEDPTLLVSRPTALVKGFLRQSFSQRATDRSGRTIGWISLATGLAATALTLIVGGVEGKSPGLFSAVSAFVAVLCISAPFSSSLVSGVPSLLLQRTTARLGAVVPGWSAIEELGNVNVVMATARDIFPPHAVSLKGIKTFEKERIDIAILYAASVLIEGCDTLKDIFSGVIQGKNDMLYKVESLVREPGRGFTAWVQNNRVVIGSREMLQKHDVTPPPVEIEVKHVPNGHMPVYLAVSGKLFAMFIVGYRADPEVKSTLNGLVKSGVSLLVTSDDMNVTNELIEHAYRLPHGVVKVLGRRELDILEPLTAYAPDSEGVMTHIGSFASFIGGMRSAAGCAASERMSSIVQMASVILAGVLCLLLAFGSGLATLSLPLALLYQAAWTLLVAILPFMRRY